MMRIRGWRRVRRRWRRVTSAFQRQAIILLYHRVAEAACDPQLLCVSPRHFEEHLEYLHRHFRPTVLLALQRMLEAGRITPKTVTITFDDGYADNLRYAKPRLEHYGTPATVFVTSGYVGRSEEFWWDEVGRILLQPGSLPETLRLRVNGSIHHWELAEAAHYTVDDYGRYRDWHVERNDDPTPRQYIYRSLCQLLHPLTAAKQRNVLQELRDWAGSTPLGRPTHLVMTPDELGQLEKGRLVQVGAHTMNHPTLSTLPVAEQRNEIELSRVFLESLTGHPIHSFAYPYGSRSDYTAETVAIARDVGFLCTCSNFTGVVRRGTDPFQLPRFLVRDWNGEEFAERLRGFSCA